MKKLSENQIKLIDQKIIVQDYFFIVRLNVSGNKLISDYECSHNIYKIDKNYKIIWEVQVENAGYARDPFVSIGLAIDEKLYASNFSGFSYVIDISTDITTRTGWNK